MRPGSLVSFDLLVRGLTGTPEIRVTIAACCQPNPGDRPNMREVLRLLAGQLGRNSRRNANSDERRYSALPEYLHSSFLQWLNDSQKLSWHRIRNILEYQDWATVQMMFCAR